MGRVLRGLKYRSEFEGRLIVQPSRSRDRLRSFVRFSEMGWREPQYVLEQGSLYELPRSNLQT